MVRLTPPGHGRLVQASSLELEVGGSEVNVAVSLARFGHPVRHVTRLPDNPLGERIVAELRRHGVDTREVHRGGNRVGLYFLERGSSQRPSLVVYDREASAFATSEGDEYDWERALEGSSWFHVSGITPALSPACAEQAATACRVARAREIPVSLDLNYRRNLWPIERAREVLVELAGCCDLVIANEEDTEAVFQIHAPGARVEDGVVPRGAYELVAREVAARTGARWVALTLRESRGASVNGWAGLLYSVESSECAISRAYDIHIIDRVGAGDAFAAGVIHGLLQRWGLRDCVEFGTAAGCLKHTIPGDFNLVSESEVRSLANGRASGRVVR